MGLWFQPSADALSEREALSPFGGGSDWKLGAEPASGAECERGGGGQQVCR
jgi:hypothetical protein